MKAIFEYNKQTAIEASYPGLDPLMWMLLGIGFLFKVRARFEVRVSMWGKGGRDRDKDRDRNKDRDRDGIGLEMGLEMGSCYRQISEYNQHPHP